MTTQLYNRAMSVLLNVMNEANVKYYLEILFKHPENQWFAPTNKKDEAFTICRQLAQEFHLIAVRSVPIWRNGSFKSCNYEFFYSKEMVFLDSARRSN